MQLDDTLENYIRRTVDFHGCFQKAPGVIIGCYMVDYAMELLGDFTGHLNAVVETRVCLADCVQVMTGCTVGNKALWLRDDIGRYATTLYDRETKEGVRVFLDVDRIDPARSPDLHAFHLRQRDPRVLTDMTFRKMSGEKVVSQFVELGRDALSHQRVTVQLPTKGPMHPSVRCRVCREPFLQDRPESPPVCASCRGDSTYYVMRDADAPRPEGSSPPAQTPSRG